MLSEAGFYFERKKHFNISLDPDYVMQTDKTGACSNDDAWRLVISPYSVDL